MQRKDKVEGEGSYTGTKDYNARTKKFVESGKVEQGGARRRAQDRGREARDGEGRAHRQEAREGSSGAVVAATS